MSLLFANLVMNMKVSTTLRPAPLRRLHPWFAGFSFTLYCIHTPAINAIGAFLVWSTGTGWNMAPVGAIPYVLYVGIVLACLVLAYLVASVTEAHTGRVRAFIMQRRRTVPVAKSSSS